MSDIDRRDCKPDGFAVAHDDPQNPFAQNFYREKRIAQIKEAEDLVCAHQQIDTLKRQRDMLLEALKLVLPLAKGYAAANLVGSNAEYIRIAEVAIVDVEGSL